MERTSRSKLTLLLVAFLLLVSISASAFFRTGYDLVAYMREYDNASRSAPGVDLGMANSFVTYVLGVFDATEDQYSAPRDLTLGQLCAIVAKYMNANPDLWGLPASFLIKRALSEAFPLR